MTDPSAEYDRGTRRVCAWCSEPPGESYVSIKHHRPASANERWFCSNECAARWFDDE